MHVVSIPQSEVRLKNFVATNMRNLTPACEEALSGMEEQILHEGWSEERLQACGDAGGNFMFLVFDHQHQVIGQRNVPAVHRERVIPFITGRDFIVSRGPGCKRPDASDVRARALALLYRTHVHTLLPEKIQPQRGHHLAGNGRPHGRVLQIEGARKIKHMNYDLYLVGILSHQLIAQVVEGAFFRVYPAQAVEKARCVHLAGKAETGAVRQVAVGGEKNAAVQVPHRSLRRFAPAGFVFAFGLAVGAVFQAGLKRPSGRLSKAGQQDAAEEYGCCPREHYCALDLEFTAGSGFRMRKENSPIWYAASSPFSDCGFTLPSTTC